MTSSWVFIPQLWVKFGAEHHNVCRSAATGFVKVWYKFVGYWEAHIDFQYVYTSGGLLCVLYFDLHFAQSTSAGDYTFPALSHFFYLRDANFIHPLLTFIRLSLNK